MPKRLCIGLLLSPLFALGGCMVHFIAPYDSSLDQSMTQVQHDSELFFNQLQADGNTDASSYKASQGFYIHTEATVRTLLTRAQAVPTSRQVAIQIEAIEATLERMQAMHERDDHLGQANITGDRGILESEFRSFFTLELALRSRRGAPASSALAPPLTPP